MPPDSIMGYWIAARQEMGTGAEPHKNPPPSCKSGIRNVPRTVGTPAEFSALQSPAWPCYPSGARDERRATPYFHGSRTTGHEPRTMFENLTEKLQRTFKNLRGQGKLTEEHLDAALAEIREALLEGDVNVGVADELLANIRQK